MYQEIHPKMGNSYCLVCGGGNDNWSGRRCWSLLSTLLPLYSCQGKDSRVEGGETRGGLWTRQRKQSWPSTLFALLGIETRNWEPSFLLLATHSSASRGHIHLTKWSWDRNYSELCHLFVLHQWLIQDAVYICPPPPFAHTRLHEEYLLHGARVGQVWGEDDLN